MSKRITTSILLSTALLPLVTPLAPVSAQVASAAPSYAVTVDGKAVEFGDSPPISQNGRVLVPLRAIFEALGAKVAFSNGVISAERGQTNLQLTLGSTQALVGDQTKTLDVAAQAINGKTFVPLRFIGEALGAGVGFNAATSSIAITSPKPAGGSGGDNGLPYNTGAQTVTGTVVRIDNTNPRRIVVVTAGQLKTYNVGANVLSLRQVSVATSLGATPARQPARPIEFGTLVPGNEVRLTLDPNNNVIQILTTATIILAKVQYAGGSQIILDDDRDTTLTIGETITYIDSNGRESGNASLNAGQTVALFLSRETRSIYRVSSYGPDLVLPGSNTVPDPLPGNVGAPQGAPQVTLVETGGPGPFKVGSRLEVSARATPGQIVTFSLGTKIQNVPMNEVPEQPGNYRGTYTVKRGDDVLEARITARLIGSNGFEDTRQSENAITIDTVPPRLIGSFPSDGARINVAQPNIVIFADDLGGSGLGSASIELVTGSANNPTKIKIPATLAPPTSINAVPPQPVSGNVRVNATILDKAGNQLTTSFSFNVSPTTPGTVQSIAHGATRAVLSGEEVPIELRSTPNGGAAFEVRSNTGTVLAKDIPMVEDNENPGRYTANYRIPDGVTGQLRIVGKFTPGDGTFSTSEATAPITVTAPAAPTKLTVATPKDGAVAQSPLVLQGKAVPNALVEVNIVARGTQLYVFEYNEDLGKTQVRADANGNWRTEGITLPARRNIAGLTYSITVTQTDAAERESEPVTLVLKGR